MRDVSTTLDMTWKAPPGYVIVTIEAHMNRVHIIGGPGSGKTTLARKLGEDGSRPVIELDAIGYVGGAGQKRALADKLVDVQGIAKQPAWVSEGIFLWWTDALLDQADCIVWLDPACTVACWRILMRHMKASIRRFNKHKGLERLWHFLTGARRYYVGPIRQPVSPDDDGAVTRAATALTLGRYGKKVVRLTNRREYRLFVEGIG